MCRDFDRDHGFTGTEQAEYDSLKARGRTMYDHLRWFHGASHDSAYAEALVAFGSKTGADTAV